MRRDIPGLQKMARSGQPATADDRELLDYDEALNVIQALEGAEFEVNVKAPDGNGRLYAIAGFSGQARWIVRSPASGGEVWRVWLDSDVPRPGTQHFSLDRGRFEGAEMVHGVGLVTLTLRHLGAVTEISVEGRT
jgi:hypothetical protein